VAPGSATLEPAAVEDTPWTSALEASLLVARGVTRMRSRGTGTTGSLWTGCRWTVCPCVVCPFVLCSSVHRGTERAGCGGMENMRLPHGAPCDLGERQIATARRKGFTEPAWERREELCSRRLDQRSGGWSKKKPPFSVGEWAAKSLKRYLIRGCEVRLGGVVSSGDEYHYRAHARVCQGSGSISSAFAAVCDYSGCNSGCNRVMSAAVNGVSGP
jgi:hypothetical protein